MKCPCLECFKYKTTPDTDPACEPACADYLKWRNEYIGCQALQKDTYSMGAGI